MTFDNHIEYDEKLMSIKPKSRVTLRVLRGMTCGECKAFIDNEHCGFGLCEVTGEHVLKSRLCVIEFYLSKRDALNKEAGDEAQKG